VGTALAPGKSLLLIVVDFGLESPGRTPGRGFLIPAKWNLEFVPSEICALPIGDPKQFPSR
jgi:hypothetical protein